MDWNKWKNVKFTKWAWVLFGAFMVYLVIQYVIRPIVGG